MEPFAVRLFEVFISKDRSRHGNCMPYTVSPAESKLYYVMEPFEKLNTRTSTPIKNIENPIQMERTAVLEDISMGEDTPDELQATVVVPVMPEEADENMEATEDNSTLKMDDAPADDTAEYDSLDDELCWMLDQTWISRRPARSDSTLGMLSKSMLSSSDEDTPAEKWPPYTPRQKRRVSFDDRPVIFGDRGVKRPHPPGPSSESSDDDDSSFWECLRRRHKPLKSPEPGPSGLQKRRPPTPATARRVSFDDRPVIFGDRGVKRPHPPGPSSDSSDDDDSSFWACFRRRQKPPKSPEPGPSGLQKRRPPTPATARRVSFDDRPVIFGDRGVKHPHPPGPSSDSSDDDDSSFWACFRRRQKSPKSPEPGPSGLQKRRPPTPKDAKDAEQ
ncbi:uncharacterized protein LOC118509336 isoform X2 [Anopheles stephensi]|uniref:uncharacterized protein LOC118509336 isoform X2 n=1 Tax=Anopheles stephensi TaxID=30069 RepID=UPI0016587417|nr:uncharacterized protein LOC118509336 isoform X2 [Anopheles stephensi]